MITEKSLRKFAELLVYVVGNFHNNTLAETKLWKLLYFCEADFFEKNQRTITGVDYYKNKYGATPDKKVIDRILSKINKKYITIEEIKKSDGRKIKIFKPVEGVNFKYNALSADEIAGAQKTCQQYYNLPVNNIIVLAHEDPPYLGAKPKEKIDFNFVNYRETESEILEKETEGCYKGTISDEAAEKLLAYVG